MNQKRSIVIIIVAIILCFWITGIKKYDKMAQYLNESGCLNGEYYLYKHYANWPSGMPFVNNYVYWFLPKGVKPDKTKKEDIIDDVVLVVINKYEKTDSVRNYYEVKIDYNYQYRYHDTIDEEGLYVSADENLEWIEKNIPIENLRIYKEGVPSKFYVTDANTVLK